MTQHDTTAEPITQRRLFRLGAVGVDSSHLPEFARRIAEAHDAGRTACRVTGFWTDGRHDMPAGDVAGWVEKATALGVRGYDSLDTMLDEVDGVLVLSVNGDRHLEHAEPALRRGLPTYIDKPLACTEEDARRIVELSRKHAAPCYSASSLRFAAEVGRIDRGRTGELIAVDAYGPGELHELMPGVLFYGVHTIEMVDAIWGPGVAAVAAEHFDDRDLVRLRYHDGRFATLRLERAGSYTFGATVHGREGVDGFVVDFATVYDRLIEGMTRFFDHDDPPTKLEHILENVRVMVAANRSLKSGGGWIELER